MKKVFLLLSLSFLFISSILYSQNNKTNVKEENKNNKEASSIAQFSLDVLSKSIKGNENIVCSPISAHILFTLLSNGVEGKTLKDMESLIGGDSKSMSEFYKSYFSNNKDTSLLASNILWLDKGLVLGDDFSNACKTYPYTKVKNIDLQEKDTKDLINKTIEDFTNHKITNLIDNINPLDKLILTNALYFKARWEDEFDKKDNIVAKFYPYKDKKTYVEYMHKLTNLKYICGKNSQGLIIPYQDTNYSFLVLLPDKKNKLDDFIKTISGAELLNMIEKGKLKLIDLYLPKFKVENSFDLSKILVDMGYNVSSYDLSPILNNRSSLNIGSVIQKTYLSIDEKETEATVASLTALVGGLEPITSIELKFNRPFIYGIIDNKTNLPIFIGAINKL